MEDKMRISLCYDLEKQDAVIYDIFIKSWPYNHTVGYSGSAQSRTSLSPICQTSLKSHQFNCVCSSHYRLWY